MTEFKQHIDFYVNHSWAGFSKIAPEPYWGNKQLAEVYLQKYWLPETEYQTIWHPIQEQIFQNKHLPALIFQPNFQLTGLRGGCMFLEEDFTLFRNTMLQMGETHFVVIQHSQEFMDGQPMFRMKFPADISWSELMSGDYIYAIIFEMFFNNYYIFGSNGGWGKYSANDYCLPLDILAYKPEFASAFSNYCWQSDEEWHEIYGWLPPEYQKLVSKVK